MKGDISCAKIRHIKEQVLKTKMSCYIGRTQKRCCRSAKKGIIAL